MSRVIFKIDVIVNVTINSTNDSCGHALALFNSYHIILYMYVLITLAILLYI